MPWVDKNKTAKAVTQTEEFEEWWKKKLESQAQLPLHEAPAFTKKEVVEKLGQVQKAWDKLKKTKKPKEKTAKNASNASTDKKADAKKKAGASAAAGADGCGGREGRAREGAAAEGQGGGRRGLRRRRPL